ncbi:PREDICTED: mas-related G-protein coupled receptor member D-like [Elephantulus edwardii]|uniref:mas-related G-protein coupled receptor member D-like n=1 Tax=Elephantulus edwardii TaxID=28737 RepID=UPI0003F07809|nr:PREDICTED: mas-related G-protein coupled receptor member D-like [Elephantulus edwardii]
MTSVQNRNSPDSPLNSTSVTFLVLQILAFLISLCGMVGNGVVVWLLAFRVQRNPFSVYVLNLAVADFLFLLCLALMIYTMDFLQNREMHYVFYSVTYFAYITSLSLLTVISVQRCLSVLFPIWCKVHRPRHLSTVVCTLVWGLALLMITLLIYFLYTEVYGDDQDYENMLTFLIILLLGLFMPIMILSSVVIFIQIQRRPRAWRQRSSRLFVIILVSVLVFLVCALPLGIFWTLTPLFKVQEYEYHLFKNLTRLTSSLSSSANPLIYFLVGRGRKSSLWEPLRAVLSRALQEEPELGGKEMPSTNTNEVESTNHPCTV